MFKVSLRTSIKHLRKDKFHSFINIAGLALGLVAFLYIATYIFHELSYDRFNSKADRIYRCVSYVKMGETIENLSTSEPPLANAAKNELPEVEAAVRLYHQDNVVSRYNENKFIEPELWYSDANIFDVFDFKLLEGNPKTALSKPNTILLTKKAAHKYFGDENPIGKSILIGNKKENYTVTGILNKIPDNSSLQFDMLASISTLPVSKRDNDWGDFEDLYTYILVKKGTDIKNFEKKFNAFPLKYEEPMLKNALGITYAEFAKQGNYFKHKLQPLKDIHLYSAFTGDLKTAGNIRFLIILGITGLLILIIACFNFVNLSTSRASLRAKEIGLKKIVGSARKTIIFQILTETFIYSLIALFIAILILLIALPVLNNYSETIIKPAYFLNPYTLLTIVIIPVLITLTAGSYPAFYITSFKPIDVLKRTFREGNTRSITRDGLITLQFVVFIVLFFSVFMIRKQTHFLLDQNPGFAKENVLVIKNAAYLGNERSSFKSELLNNPSVISASYSSVVPSVRNNEGNSFAAKGSNKGFIMDRMTVDCDFQKTFKVKLLSGRFFTDNTGLERTNAIINEEAAKLLGWNDCNGKYIHDYNNGGQDFKVIGILKTFHLRSLGVSTKPLVIRLANTNNYLSVRLHPGNLTDDIKAIKSQWESFNNDTPFEYFFLDQAFDALYKSEIRLTKIIGLFTLMAILIACFGLFGLISFTANQKRKEIGIRKVNGARIIEVMAMLNRDLMGWIAIAFIIACPIAWIAMHKWLEGFANKTELSWWVFALAGGLALGIALLTVSFQSWKAAARNPVEALRYE